MFNLAGDLDPQTSKHTLVPLKIAYKKLRLLVDLGCIFIGHGLKSDFRIISTCYWCENYCNRSHADFWHHNFRYSGTSWAGHRYSRYILYAKQTTVSGFFSDYIYNTSVIFIFISLWHRKISLRFLAWALLQLDIQQVTHNSIEDAKTVSWDISVRFLNSQNRFSTCSVLLYRVTGIAVV